MVSKSQAHSFPFLNFEVCTVHQPGTVADKTALSVNMCLELQLAAAAAALQALNAPCRLNAALLNIGHTHIYTYILVSCAGHGGGGVTLSWGCAREVVALVQQALS